MADPNTAVASKRRDTLAAAIAMEKELHNKYPAKYGKKDGFEGYGYGKDQYVCTTFACKVLSRAGYDISPAVDKQVNIVIDWKKETGKAKPTAKDTQSTLAKLLRRLRDCNDRTAPPGPCVR